jgi:citrate lyase subunit beta/citryl-CoA lyase
MNTLGPIRSALFVPGNRPDRVDKAVRAGADAVIIDLEDAVPMAAKEDARLLAAEKVSFHREYCVLVRINALETGLAEHDIDAVVVDGLKGIVLPKAARAGDMDRIHSLLLEAEKKNRLDAGSVALVPLIESALGVENAFRVASAESVKDRIYTIAFGAADYSLDLGIDLTLSGEELYYPRARLAVACRAAELEPPIDTPYMIDITDLSGLEVDAVRARQVGFQGKLCIHPKQVPVVNNLFSPTAEDIAEAQRIVDAFVAAEADGAGAVQLDGKFIDYPVVAKAKRILSLAACLK